MSSDAAIRSKVEKALRLILVDHRLKLAYVRRAGDVLIYNGWYSITLPVESLGKPTSDELASLIVADYLDKRS